MIQRNIINFVIMLTVAATAPVGAEVIYSNGFNSMSAGQASDGDIKRAWDTRYAKGPDEGRVRIINGGPNVRSGKSGRVLYPRNANQPQHSGATWETDINRSAEELYISYWVKFDSDFDFVKGGKLPGLAGMTYFPGGDHKWHARLMWREEGKIEFYLRNFQVNNSKGKKPFRVFWDDFGGHAKFTKGRWHHLEMRVKLNSPGRRDGLLEGWLDGELRCRDTDNSGVRAAGQGSTKINYVYFSTFFGGSSSPVSQWQPKRDVFAFFDDMKVSTTRLGSSGGGSSTSSSSSSSNSSSNSSSSGSSGSCLSYSGSAKKELNLGSSTCVNVSGGLSGKTLQVWDSDTNSSCNFRGSVSSANGNGSMSVNSNYESKSGFTGSRLRFNASNGCRYVKMRLY